MHRSTPLIMTLLVICVSAFSQTATRSDSQTLEAILAELRQLRHDLQTTNAMAARAQIALYRLQREDEAVARANQRVSDVRTRVIQLEDARHHKAQDIEQDKAVANRSDTSPNSQQEFEEVVFPRLKSELELLQKQEQQAQAEQAEAEQHLRDEQMKLEELNDLLDRYNTALEQVGRK
jgi:chromosome segregation ATPase